MTGKIDILSAAQERRLAEMEEEWITDGRNCAPLDRRRAAGVLAEMYGEIGRPAPHVLFFSSPLLCIAAQAAMGNRATIAENAEISMQLCRRFTMDLICEPEGTLPRQLTAQLNEKPRQRVSDELMQRIYAQVRRQLADPLTMQIFASLDGPIDLPFWNRLEVELAKQMDAQCYGRVDPDLSRHISPQSNGGLFCWSGQLADAELATYAWASEAGLSFDAESTRLLELMRRQKKELHYWFPFAGLVLASERPVKLFLDGRGRLHHSTAKAMEFADGWGVCAWHGTWMPDRYFATDVKSSESLSEPNVEVRRCLIERYDETKGNGSFLRDCGARVLDSRIQPMHVGGRAMLNELLAVELPGDPEERMVALRVVCPSTGREYVIRVPPQQTAVKSALAWSFGLTAEEYDLAQET